MNMHNYLSPLLLTLAFVFFLSMPRSKANDCFAGDAYAGDKYEYKVARITTVGIPEELLNASGEEGWELVLIHQEQRFKYLIFKRKVIDGYEKNKQVAVPSGK